MSGRHIKAIDIPHFQFPEGGILFFVLFFLRTLLIFPTPLFTYPNDKFKENQAQSHIILLFNLFIPAAAIPTWPCLILRFHVRKFIYLLPTPTLSNIVHVKGSILTSLLLPTFFRNEGGTAICQQLHQRLQKLARYSEREVLPGEELDTRLQASAIRGPCDHLHQGGHTHTKQPTYHTPQSTDVLFQD